MTFAVIDVASGEYGYEYVDKMISLVDNGRCCRWSPDDASEKKNGSETEKSLSSGDSVETMISSFEEDIDPKHLRARSSNWQQFCTLYKRRTTQMWRDSVNEFDLWWLTYVLNDSYFTMQSYMKLRIYMTFFLGLVVGGIYQGIGNDASKALFNFGFCFTVTIAFMYNPLMPVLLQCKSLIASHPHQSE